MFVSRVFGTGLHGRGREWAESSLPLFFEGMRSPAHALLSSPGPRARSLDRKHVSPNPQLAGEIWCLIVPLALSS